MSKTNRPRVEKDLRMGLRDVYWELFPAVEPSLDEILKSKPVLADGVLIWESKTGEWRKK